jgi:hypothetical protein
MTQFLNYKHISIDEAIVSLQNPPVLCDEAIMSLLKFVKRSADKVGRSVSVSEDRTVGTPPTFACGRVLSGFAKKGSQRNSGNFVRFVICRLIIILWICHCRMAYLRNLWLCDCGINQKFKDWCAHLWQFSRLSGRQKCKQTCV